MINQPQDSGSDEIRRLMQDEVIARIPLLLKYTSSAGLRLQVPETDIQIIAGPRSWIQKQAVADQTDAEGVQTKGVEELLRYNIYTDCHHPEGHVIISEPDGEYVKYSDVSAHLAGQSQATRAVPEGDKE